MSKAFHWTCNWFGCTVGGTESSQVEADDAKAVHMAYCNKKPEVK